MPRNFSQDINNLKREAEALKISYVKTATAIRTKAVQITVQLVFDSITSFGTVYTGTTKKVYIENVSLDKIMACCITLDNDGTVVSGHNLDSRTINIQRASEGDYSEWLISGTSLNASDRTIVWNGGTVTMNYVFTITATSNFTVGVQDA